MAVVWCCNTCRLPVSLAVQATREERGWRLHINQAITAHMKQH